MFPFRFIIYAVVLVVAGVLAFLADDITGSRSDDSAQRQATPSPAAGRQQDAVVQAEFVAVSEEQRRHLGKDEDFLLLAIGNRRYDIIEERVALTRHLQRASRDAQRSGSPVLSVRGPRDASPTLMSRLFVLCRDDPDILFERVEFNNRQ